MWGGAKRVLSQMHLFFWGGEYECFFTVYTSVANLWEGVVTTNKYILLPSSTRKSDDEKAYAYSGEGTLESPERRFRCHLFSYNTVNNAHL